MKLFDTITAIATGNTVSAIGIIRISGSNALTAADSVFRASCNTRLSEAQERKMYYGELVDSENELLDMCLCVISRAPNSYTGEDTAELHCHGSPVIMREVIRQLQKYGVRLAEPGEFTKRAFLNGKMDLTQSEAVIDIIEAETTIVAKNAARQLQGVVFEKMNNIYEKLVDVMAHFHAVIDYPDEDIDEFTVGSYLEMLSDCKEQLEKLAKTHEKGTAMQTGIPTAIVGRVNTGKSSLLNALLGYERAIVTDIPGTTRDTIEEKVLIGNVLLRLIDTAGLRKTDDTVEKLGLERTLAALKSAKLVLAVFDGSEPLQDDDREVLNALTQDVPVIYITNKADLSRGDGSLGSPCSFSGLSVSLSAKTGEGISRLADEIQKIFPDEKDIPVGEIITNARQAQAIITAARSIGLATEALSARVSPDAVLTDIEAAICAIGEVTGKKMREDIVSRIFERFCVGK